MDHRYPPDRGFWDDPWDRPPSRLSRRHAKKTPPPPGREGQPTPEPVPQARRRGGWGIRVAVILILAASAAALVIAGLSIWGYGSLHLTVSTTPEPAVKETTIILPEEMEAEADDAPACYLEQAPLGDGTTLELYTANGLPELSYEEIYAANIDTVVSLVCALKDGSYCSGTGVIFSSDGYIVTNEHVIESATDVTVGLQNGDQYSAAFIGMDVQTDLAVLKIDATGLPAAQFGLPEEIVVGNSVVAIGNPLGTSFRGTMTTGIVSAINRNVQVNGSYMNLIQTDAAINSGNSGGPLINRFGQVIGICNMKMMSTTTTVEGIGFAIPSSTVSTIVNKLIEKGEVVRAMLGITAYDLPAQDCAALGIEGGIYVVTVNANTDAFAQGIRNGDIITAANGIPVDSVDALNTMKFNMSPGDTIVLTILRDGTYTDYNVTLMREEDVE